MSEIIQYSILFLSWLFLVLCQNTEQKLEEFSVALNNGKCYKSI